MVFLFIHGGPGLNSNPEKFILQGPFHEHGHEIFFWNEPSPKRDHPSDFISYEDSCRSLEQTIRSLAENGKIAVIAHSFGAFVLNDILPVIETYLQKIILISPVSSLHSLDFNIIKAGAEATQDKDEKDFLEKYVQQMSESSLYDSERFNALKMAIKANQLIGQYWHEKDFMGSYYGHFSDDKYQFSLDSYNSIRTTCSKNVVTSKTSVSTQVIYGAHDPYISPGDISILRDLYINSNAFLLENSSHYGYIEETPEFLKILTDVTVKNINIDSNSTHNL